MEKGIVYLVSNPCFPDYVKIGKTDDLRQRLKVLSGTNVPEPFELHYAINVEDAAGTERRLHRAFDKMRPNKNREFFEIDPDSARAAMELICGEEVKLDWEADVEVADWPSFAEARRRADTKRDNFRFESLGISVGAILTFVDDKSITCEVAENNQVKYDGEIMSLSGAAKSVLRKRGNISNVSGSHLWVYGNETLIARRNRLEAGESNQPAIIPE
ncbi:MAG: GIY-YIG nuclease family protein [Betaproteobacteria bacterium]|nr:GIY-YIG nuclease family protein [Betaproteobacteria bacterium]